MSSFSRFALSAALIVTAWSAPVAAEPRRPAQLVMISFDGANDNALWRRSLALGEKTGASFTYFLSCVFLLGPETKSAYRGPGHKAGRSNVGFASSVDDVASRLANIWAARSQGHEIGSHACGHFEGGEWSAADWKLELSAFASIAREAYAINGIAGEPAGWRGFVASEIKAFRAPYLSASPALYEALAEAGYTHDASGVSNGPAQPQTGDDGVARHALPMVPEGPRSRPVIAMDYNLFVRHSGGFEREDKDGAFEERAYRAFYDALAREMEGERNPLELGFHFNLMNGGAYWRALERFAAEACTRTDVRCVSYAQANDILRRRAHAASIGPGG